MENLSDHNPLPIPKYHLETALEGKNSFTDVCVWRGEGKQNGN